MEEEEEEEGTAHDGPVDEPDQHDKLRENAMLHATATNVREKKESAYVRAVAGVHGRTQWQGTARTSVARAGLGHQSKTGGWQMGRKGHSIVCNMFV